MKVLSNCSVLLLMSIMVSACTSKSGVTADACGASQYQSLVGGPSSAVMSLDIPGDSRHYGSKERVATNVPSRLNFIHSGTAVEAVSDASSTVKSVFCG